VEFAENQLQVKR